MISETLGRSNFVLSYQNFDHAHHTSGAEQHGRQPTTVDSPRFRVLATHEETDAHTEKTETSPHLMKKGHRVWFRFGYVWMPWLRWPHHVAGPHHVACSRTMGRRDRSSRRPCRRLRTLPCQRRPAEESHEMKQWMYKPGSLKFLFGYEDVRMAFQEEGPSMIQIKDWPTIEAAEGWYIKKSYKTIYIYIYIIHVVRIYYSLEMVCTFRRL